MSDIPEKLKEQIKQHHEIQEKYLVEMHTKLGQVWEIPDCCIRQFCKETLLGIPSAVYREMRYHLPIPPLGYVPCDKCMKKHYEDEI